ncbi:MAG: branched-chain amino acid ABC transporter permease, partial [Gammaproteobacteria bacterium]
PPSLFGRESSGPYPLYALTCVAAFLAAWAMHAYFGTPLGRLSPAIRDNEIRVEYMGASVRSAIHVKYVIAGALAGAGGALAAMTVGHIDPEMAYWTTSGEFVFVAILSGIGSVVAPFFGSLIFEVVRSVAYQYSPNSWQLALGVAMLAVIVFLPGGLWSLFSLRRKEV